MKCAYGYVYNKLYCNNSHHLIAIVIFIIRVGLHYEDEVIILINYYSGCNYNLNIIILS